MSLFESTEDLELLPITEIIDDSVIPLEDYSEEETQELAPEASENLEGFSSKLETTEMVTDLEMIEGIADYLESVEELKYENWSNLSLEERAEVLNKMEQVIAAIEHRPALKVELQEMEPRHLGYQSASEHKIVLNSLYVGSNDPSMHREVIDTIVHEGRHAYQHYNVDEKLIHESGSEVESWRENFYSPEYGYYRSGKQKVMIPFPDGSIHDVDFRLYYYQPVEIDARNFASEVINALEEKGIVSAKENK